MKQHLIAVTIILFFTVLGIMSAENAFSLEAQGRGRNIEQATENAHIAAHFACNRKGLWADLDKVKVERNERKEYKLAGGRRVMTDSLVFVSFPCRPDYARYPTE